MARPRHVPILAVAAVVALAAPLPAADGGASRVRNEGYGLLYELLSSLRDTDKILYVKIEADPVEAFVERLAGTSDRIASRLEALDERDRELRLDVTGLPEMELRSREAIRETQLRAMAPIVGESGIAFERRLLLGHVKALDQLRHLTDVLLEVERVEERRELLRDADRDLEELYGDLNGLLEARYFCAPNGEDGGEEQGES